MISLLAILILLFLFHIGPYPMIKGFIKGYLDARNGRPYNNKEENGEEQQ